MVRGPRRERSKDCAKKVWHEKRPATQPRDNVRERPRRHEREIATKRGVPVLGLGDAEASNRYPFELCVKSEHFEGQQGLAETEPNPFYAETVQPSRNCMPKFMRNHQKTEKALKQNIL